MKTLSKTLPCTQCQNYLHTLRRRSGLFGRNQDKGLAYQEWIHASLGSQHAQGIFGMQQSQSA